MKRKSVFVILQRTDSEDILCVSEPRRTSLPGGKMEIDDRSKFTALRREFYEEIQCMLPSINFRYFEWGTRASEIRVFYAKINSKMADDICQWKQSRINDNPQEEVKSCAWMPVQNSFSLAPHAVRAVAIWQNM